MSKKVKAHELTDATIDFVSLVGKGANKRKFTILKTEEPAAPSITDRLKALVSTEDQVAALVTSILCDNDYVEITKRAILAAGLKVDNIEEFEGVTIFKQDGFDKDAAGSLLAINENILVGFDRVVKGLDPYPGSMDFTENLAAGSFYPGFSAAMNALSDTVYICTREADQPGDCAETVAKALDAFASHVKGLVNQLPSTVFKMEVSVNQESDMNLAQRILKGPQIDEVQSGDLAGLNDAPVAKAAEPVAAVTPVAAPVAAVAAPVAEVAKAVDQSLLTDKDAPALDAAAQVPAVVAEDAIAKAIGALAAQMAGINALLTAQTARLDAVESVAKEAVAKAEAPRIVNNNVKSESLATLRGHEKVQKANASNSDALWDGVMSQFDARG